MNIIELAIEVALYDIEHDEHIEEYGYIDCFIDDAVNHFKLDEYQKGLLIDSVLKKVLGFEGLTISDLLDLFKRSTERAYLKCTLITVVDIKIPSEWIQRAVKAQITDMFIKMQDAVSIKMRGGKDVQ